MIGFKLMIKSNDWNRRKVTFYTRVAATTPQDKSSRCRICRFRDTLRENIGDTSSTTSQMDKLFEVAWIYLNHMSFCLNFLHFSSDVDCICEYFLFKWVITQVSVETRLSSILYLFSNRALLLTCSSLGVNPKYSTNGSGPKKVNRQDPITPREERWCLYVDPFSTTKRRCLV